MCGIAGVIGKEEEVRGLVKALYHRGPDEEGFATHGAFSMGMRRLSIIDLAGGHQPIYSADGRYSIVFNGEIYNYKELKAELGEYPYKTESDTEVILAGFVKWGAGVLPRLRGMFVFAIYDTEEKEVFIARDFFGIKPLYYLLNKPEGFRAFSSEIKSFLTLPDFKPEVNDTAVYNYLSFQYNPLDETFFNNVFKLPPGHSMTVDVESGEFRVEKYWQFKFGQKSGLGEKETSKRIKDVMEDSVAHHMIADVPVGSFLSGGIDSSIIATLMQKIRGDKKIKTFTVGFDTASEGKEARETAEPLGTDHKEFTVGPDEYFAALPKVMWHFDEPVADPSALGLYFLAREARKEVKVVLSGEGSDELFGGYNIYLESYARKWISWIPKSVLRLMTLVPLRGRNFAKRALTPLEERYIGNASIFSPKEVEKIWNGKGEKFSLKDIYRQVDGLSDSTKMQYVDIHTWLVGDILAKADKMTMAHSLELRVPFLDTKVAAVASTLPDRFKWRSGETKYLPREAFRNVLPESTRKRKKLGFPTPVRHWFTRERGDIYKTILDNAYIREHMDSNYISNLIEEHVSKKADNSRKIYLLLALAIWYNVFILGQRPA